MLEFFTFILSTQISIPNINCRENCGGLFFGLFYIIKLEHHEKYTFYTSKDILTNLIFGVMQKLRKTIYREEKIKYMVFPTLIQKS